MVPPLPFVVVVPVTRNGPPEKPLIETPDEAPLLEIERKLTPVALVVLLDHWSAWALVALIVFEDPATITVPVVLAIMPGTPVAAIVSPPLRLIVLVPTLFVSTTPPDPDPVVMDRAALKVAESDVFVVNEIPRPNEVIALEKVRTALLILETATGWPPAGVLIVVPTAIVAVPPLIKNAVPVAPASEPSTMVIAPATARSSTWTAPPEAVSEGILTASVPVSSSIAWLTLTKDTVSIVKVPKFAPVSARSDELPKLKPCNVLLVASVTVLAGPGPVKTGGLPPAGWSVWPPTTKATASPISR